MTKAARTITIDFEIVEFFKKSSYNMSGTINELLHDFIATSQKIPKKAGDLPLLKKELARAEKEKIKIDSEVNQLRNQLDKITTEIEEAEIKHLKAEKERKKRLSQCERCGNTIPGPINIKGEERSLCLNCAYAQ